MGKTVQNTLKGGATERRGGETKIFKRGRQAGSRGEFLKKMGEGGGGAGTPLQTMAYFFKWGIDSEM